MWRMLPALVFLAAISSCADEEEPAPVDPSALRQPDTRGTVFDARGVPLDTHADALPSDLGSPDPDVPPSDAVAGEDDSGPSLADSHTPDAGSADTTPPEPDPTANLNAGWIGGPCTNNADCDYPNGFCIPDAEGFPSGMCSAPCDKFCPDEEGQIVTYCISAPSVDLDSPPGLCTTRCDFDQSASGCRPGYECIDMPRHNDPGTVKPACLPLGSPGSEGGSGDPSTPTSSCQEQLAAEGIWFNIASNPKDSPEGHPNLICDIPDPIYVEGVLHGVHFRYDNMDNPAGSLFVNCPLALAMSKTAQHLADQGFTDVLHWGVYNCRVISGTSKLSQHGLANAIDVRALRHSSGAIYTVLDDWEKDTPNPVSPGGSHLLWLVETLYAEWVYNIILTPDYNAAHEDHFHMDLTPGSHFLK